MPSDIPNFPITIPIYQGVDLMDVAAPCELFGWWASNTADTLNVTVTLVAETLEPVSARANVILTPTQTFDDYYNNNWQSSLIWTPGGSPDELHYLMQPGTAYLEFLIQQSENAEWVTSVCEGALLLAAAGLLNGYTATTHWQFIPCLEAFPEVNVAQGYPRYIFDRNRVTGGGISSGLDEALAIIAAIAGTAMAQSVQLYTQYFPAPPVGGAIPPWTTCPVDMSGVQM
jgi:transcriptional regulator GlxA family with amidase domain